jgi:hypothetical protein
MEFTLLQKVTTDTGSYTADKTAKVQDILLRAILAVLEMTS